MNLLESALEYKNKYEFSLIPFKNDKTTAYFKWDEFKTRQPTDQEITEWWTKWPDAMIAAITGKLSNLLLIDFDTYKIKSEKILKEVNDLIPFTVPGPIATTPRGGYHRYFSYLDGVGCSKSKPLSIDIKGEGGLAILPPSANGNGKSYVWQPSREMENCLLGILNVDIYNNILNAFKKYIYIEGRNVADELSLVGGVSNVTDRFISFNEGDRDDSVYHAAWCLVKGGMEHGNLFKILKPLGDRCNPPLPDKDILKIIKSAIERASKRDSNIAGEVKEFVDRSNGFFSVTDLIQSVPYVSNRPAVRLALHRLVEKTLLERHPTKDGVFRRVDKTFRKMDWRNATDDEFGVVWPFALEHFISIKEKNIVLVAGVTNAGKTLFCMDFARMNADNFKVRYINTEMGESELKSRIKAFKNSTEEHFDKIDFIEPMGPIWNYIEPDKYDVFVIDYLKILENFFEVGKIIESIYEKLGDKVCLISIQKSAGKDTGRGGDFTLDIPRLALALNKGWVKVIKSKCNKKKNFHMDERSLKFEIIEDHILKPIGSWA